MRFDAFLTRDDTKNADSLLRAVFPTEFEAELVGTLRATGALACEHTLWHQGALIGYIGYSTITLKPREDSAPVSEQPIFLGVGPVAIAADFQGKGCGKDMLDKSFAAVKADALVLLGHVGFYKHFGFTAAANFDLQFGEDSTREAAFLAKEITANALKPYAGIARYHDAFYQV
jgi:putative acetyltransferase